MPTTRKKVNKTVYEEASSEEDKGRDFSDSGSDAKISQESSSEDDEVELAHSSGDEFNQKSKNLKNLKRNRKHPQKKTTFAKDIIKKISKQTTLLDESDNTDKPPALFSIKDLSEADKLLPSILNLSESDSSDDESPKSVNKQQALQQHSEQQADSDNECITEYKDVWSNNMQTHDNGEEIAKKTFMELEQHKSIVEEAKASVQNYTLKLKEQESDVKDLLALGEEVLPVPKVGTINKKPKFKSRKDDSDSEMEDWEEVKETKAVPQQGIQLFVEFPDAAHRKTKKVDVEMMMKRKINRVKKEYQVYMHKVHVLCWLGHGNYVNRVLNDQELMAAALSLVPSKECYPGDRVDMKFVEQITSWYKDKLTLKQDKNEDKFKPNAPPLKTILLDLIKKRIVTTKKYLAFIFVAMLRALGLQCRVMFNFVALPIKPPSSELCSLSTKPNDEKANMKLKPESSDTRNKSGIDKKKSQTEPKASNSKTNKQNLAQVDGNYDTSSDNENMDIDWSYDYVSKDAYENIMQVDGGDDNIATKRTRSTKRATTDTSVKLEEEDVSPPKIVKRSARASPKPSTRRYQNVDVTNEKAKSKTDTNKKSTSDNNSKSDDKEHENVAQKSNNVKKTTKDSKSTNKNATNASADNRTQNNSTKLINSASKDKCNIPKIIISDENKESIASKYFENTKTEKPKLSRKRSSTANPTSTKNTTEVEENRTAKVKERTKSTPGTAIERSKYFSNDRAKQNTPKQPRRKVNNQSDEQRVSHRDLARSSSNGKADITGDLVNIIKSRIKEAKSEARKGIVKGKIKRESDEDSDYLPVENLKHSNSGSDDDFKPTKISPKPSTSRCINRRVLSSSSSSSSSSERAKKNKIDVWCEIFVEELEQWIPVDVIKGNIYSTTDIYASATRPVCYVVGWDNNNYLKDLTRKYVPHYNTETRKLRVEPMWWDEAVRPYLGPNTARNREEDEYLDKMQLEAPLPKSIGEYKNHPLYALKRHLLKFEAIYPPDAAVLGFVRSEAVYARECVYVCRSRDTWLKEAKVVRLGEIPYKVVKARPKWDKLSNQLITDKPLEVFGPWQVQDYEPPVAENGVVPRNAYGNVELFKDCMLPKGTVHIKLPGLNRVAKKLDIDCAPAMTGFDFNGGWSHPVYDGFVVCKEFEEIITEAWVKDQEEQERKELEKIELRVYGNWKRLIKGLLIRERLKNKYGFDDPKTSAPAKGKSKGPKLVVKKKS